VSTAAVALANGINANLLRRWISEAEGSEAIDREQRVPYVAVAQTEESFVRLDAPTPPSAADSFRIELRRGEVSVTIDWPLSHAAQCATLLGAVLR
jgi:transposase-like protein